MEEEVFMSSLEAWMDFEKEEVRDLVCPAGRAVCMGLGKRLGPAWLAPMCSLCPAHRQRSGTLANGVSGPEAEGGGCWGPRVYLVPRLNLQELCGSESVT